MARINQGAQYSTFWAGAAPLSTVASSGFQWIGVYYQFLIAGRIVGMRTWMDAAGGPRRYGWFAKDGQTQFVQFVTYLGWHKNPTTTQWTSAFSHPWWPVAAGDTFVFVSSFSSGTHYGLMVAAHTGDTDTTHGHILLPKDTGTRPNGATSTPGALNVGTSMTAAKPAIDVLFLPH